MNAALSIVAFVVVAVALDTFWVALFRARPVGKFRVLCDTTSTLAVTSKTGNFIVDKSAGVLKFACGKRRGTLRLSEIKGLEYRVNEKTAILEELFFGLSLTDLLPAYQDTIEWFSISVVATNGTKVPLYLSGRYCPREFLMGWYIELQSELLSRLGLLRDVEVQSRSALALIQASLGSPRLL
jgi:hypothetical protein